MIFKQKDKTFNRLKEVKFLLEKDIQKLVETNLKNMLDLDFLTTEFAIENYRFDTIAFNCETNAFYIIEYKKLTNDKLVDQGFAYLGTMLKRKADFVLLYNRVKKANKQINDFDWSQARIVFISPSYSSYQLDASTYLNLPFDLYLIKRYENDIVSFEKVEDRKKVAENFLKDFEVIKDENVSKVINEIKVYTEYDHLEGFGAKEEIIELYEKLKSRILEWGSVEVEPRKFYIAFRGSKNITDIAIQKNQLKLWINLRKGQLKDTEGFSRDCSTIGHWGNGDYEMAIKDDSKLDYILSLIKQSWEINK